jgi:hypothetical protein
MQKERILSIMFKNENSLNPVIKKISIIFLISSIVISISYVATYYWGTEMVLTIYGINEENTIFDKTYDLVKFDVDNHTNKPYNRIIVYSKSGNIDEQKALVLHYSKKNGRLIYILSLDITDEFADIKEYHIFSRGTMRLDYFIPPESPHVANIKFRQYNNVNPKEILRDYTYMDYYLNGTNFYEISISILKKDENLNEKDKQKQHSTIKELLRKEIGEDKILTIIETIRTEDINP